MKTIRGISTSLLVAALLIAGASAQATEKITNGGFEATPPLNGWSANNWGSSGTISATRDTNNPISGSASARIDIGGSDDPASNEWFWLNFRQTFSVTAGRTYVGTYKVRASEPVTMAVQLSEVESPYRNIAWTEVNLDVGVQELRVVGVSEFSGDAQIYFHFGKTKRGVEIWLDDVSVLERTPGPTTASITVDFSKSEPDALDQSGILLGLRHPDLQEPGDQLIEPLNPKYWRVRPSEGWISRAENVGSIPVALLSEGWYPGDNPATRPEAPFASPERMTAWSNHCHTVASTHGTNVIYDIWNEPDHPTFFTNWENGTWDNFLLTYKVAHDAVRAAVPNAVIAGPSTSADFPWPLLERFMDFCLAEGLTVQILATHLFGDVDPSFEHMRDDLLKMRDLYIDNSHYAAVGTEQYMATEHANPVMVFRPGSMLALLRFMEEGLSDGAMRSTWDVLDPGVNTAFNGSLGGLLTSDLKSPRAIWWAMKWYADGFARGDGQRVEAVSNNQEIIPLASLNSAVKSESQVLIGSRAYGGSAQAMSAISVTLDNLVSSGIVEPSATELPVWVYIAPNASGAAAYTEPTLVTNFTATVSSGTSTFTLSNAHEGYDALLIRFAEMEPIDFSVPVPPGTWSGEGTGNDLNTAANWGGDAVPASGATATWAGFEEGNLNLTFGAAVGGAAGWKFHFTANQTGNISFSNTAAASRNLRINAANDALTMAAGTGGVQIGTLTGTVNPIQVVLGQSGGTLQLNNNSSNALVFGSNTSIASGGAGTHDVAFYGTGVTRILGIYSSNTANAGGFIRVRNGRLVLEGDNQHTGYIMADSGVTEFTSTAAIGTGNFIRVGQAHLSGTLRYSGDGDAVVNRRISLGNGSEAAHTGNATIESTGLGKVVFNNATFNLDASQHASVTRTLTLRGASTADNEIQGIIANNASGAGVIAVTKTDAGKWILSGANTYTGDTTINDGKLVLANAGALGNSTLEIRGGVTEIANGITAAPGSGKIANVRNTTDLKSLAVQATGNASAVFSGNVNILDTANRFTLHAGAGDTLTLSGNLYSNAADTQRFTKTGEGTVILSGSDTSGNHLRGENIVEAGRLLLNGNMGNATGSFTVQSGAAIGGGGSVGGGLAMADGAKLVFSTNATLTVGGNVTFAGSFDPTDLILADGLSWGDIASGTYTLIDGNVQDFSTYVSTDWIIDIAGSGKDVRFQEGSLDLEVRDTSTGPTIQPDIGSIGIALDGSDVVVTVAFDASGNDTYTLQFNTNLVAGAGWIDVVTNATATPLVWTNNHSPAFFRIKAE